MTLKSMIATAALAIPLMTGSAFALDMGATDKPIKLAMNEWTGPAS